MNNKLLKYIFYSLIIFVFLFYIILPIGNTIRIKYSDEYGIAKKYISENVHVTNKLGKVKEFDSFPSGGIKYENGIIYAQIETEVYGEKKNGEVFLTMKKNPGESWEFLELYIDD